jgi:hypothetical protein
MQGNADSIEYCKLRDFHNLNTYIELLTLQILTVWCISSIRFTSIHKYMTTHHRWIRRVQKITQRKQTHLLSKETLINY